MSRFTEVCGRYQIAYGWDHVCGVFVQVFEDGVENPVVDDDARFDGLTLAEAIATAQKYGATQVEKHLMQTPMDGDCRVLEGRGMATRATLATGAYEMRRRVLETVLDESFRENERVNAAADLAGRAIGRGNAQDWGYWLLWILQMLDDHFSDAAEVAMQEVREGINHRLDTGKW